MIDLAKAEALMRSEGLEVLPSAGSSAVGYRPDGDTFMVPKFGHPPRAVVDGVGRSAADMERLASRLLLAAAFCRRIESECQKPEAP